jgi:hypothetical protein
MPRPQHHGFGLNARERPFDPIFLNGSKRPRYGSAARGDPLYEAMVQVGKLLRTVFLCDYFVNEAFRRELLRVLTAAKPSMP